VGQLGEGGESPSPGTSPHLGRETLEVHAQRSRLPEVDAHWMGKLKILKVGSFSVLLAWFSVLLLEPSDAVSLAKRLKEGQLVRRLAEDDRRKLREVLLSKLRASVGVEDLHLAVRGVESDYLYEWLHEQRIVSPDRHHIREFFYELSMAGMGYFGTAGRFYFTEKALSILKQDADVVSPLDPQGYLDSLVSRHRDLDPIVREYLAEAVQAINSGCVRSAAMCLGAASETFVLALGHGVEAWRQARAAAGRKPPTKGEERISAALDRIVDVMRQNKDALQALNVTSPDDWSRRFERMADMIRWSRNDAGHPSHVAVDRFGAWEGLVIFHQLLLEGWELLSVLRSDSR